MSTRAGGMPPCDTRVQTVGGLALAKQESQRAWRLREAGNDSLVFILVREISTSGGEKKLRNR